MSKFKSFVIIASLFLVASFLFVGTAFAVNISDLRPVSNCSLITRRLSATTEKSNKARNKHIAKYIAAKDKINALVVEFDAKGYDTAKIKSDLLRYDELLKAFSDDYTAYLAGITASENYVCGRARSEFVAQLASTREKLKLVRNDADAVRAFWKDTLKVELTALASQGNTKAEGGE